MKCLKKGILKNQNIGKLIMKIREILLVIFCPIIIFFALFSFPLLFLLDREFNWERHWERNFFSLKVGARGWE